MQAIKRWFVRRRLNEAKRMLEDNKHALVRLAAEAHAINGEIIHIQKHIVQLRGKLGEL